MRAPVFLVALFLASSVASGAELPSLICREGEVLSVEPRSSTLIHTAVLRCTGSRGKGFICRIRIGRSIFTTLDDTGFRYRSFNPDKAPWVVLPRSAWLSGTEPGYRSLIPL